MSEPTGVMLPTNTQQEKDKRRQTVLDQRKAMLPMRAAMVLGL